MEWDFTTKDVVLREVSYSLLDFIEDLKKEIDFNFSDLSAKERKKTFVLIYRLLHLTVVGRKKVEILKVFEIDAEFYKEMMESNKGNRDMLQAIHISMFLRNLSDSQGLLGDRENLKLINDELTRFHLKHNL